MGALISRLGIGCIEEAISPTGSILEGWRIETQPIRVKSAGSDPAPSTDMALGS